MAEKTTTVIVNWNGSIYLPSLLESLRIENPAGIIVVDNASTDNSMELLKNCDGVRLIRNERNLGFGVAANQGIAVSKTPYVLLLNADIELTRGAVGELERFLDATPSAAIAAPQLIYPDRRLQPSCRRFPTPVRLFLYLSYLDHLIPTGYRLSEKMHHELREVQQPMGAALMIRRSVLSEVGDFDPRFFLYMEEVDLCERIHRQGWKIFYVPQAKIIHHAGGSSRHEFTRSQQQYLESVVRYFQKRSSPARVFVLRLMLSAAMPLRAFVLLLRGRVREALFCFTMTVRIFSLS